MEKPAIKCSLFSAVGSLVLDPYQPLDARAYVRSDAHGKAACPTARCDIDGGGGRRPTGTCGLARTRSRSLPFLSHALAPSLTPLLSIFQENLSLRERTPPNSVSEEGERARKRERKSESAAKRNGQGRTVAAPRALPRSPSSVFGRSCGEEPKVCPAEVRAFRRPVPVPFRARSCPAARCSRARTCSVVLDRRPCLQRWRNAEAGALISVGCFVLLFFFFFGSESSRSASARACRRWVKSWCF